MSNKDKEKVLLEEPVSAGTEAALSAPTYTPGKYTPSKSVTDAADALQKHSVQSPGTYKSKWQEKIDGTVDKILNREEFSYDVNGDALYKQYADKFTRQGKTAMEDTIARASAMTGGYGNSYAQTAGQAAYAGEMQKLNDVIPELYQMALDKYTREGETLRDNYAMLTDAENTEYGRHRDTVSDWRDERAYLADRYDTESERDYSRFIDDESLRAESAGQMRDDYWTGKRLDREDEAIRKEDERYKTERQYQLERDAKEDAAVAKSEAYDNALVQAALGNYGALAKYHNITEEQAATLYASMGDKPTTDEKDLYGGYTRAEFNTLMSDYAEEPDAAARYVRAADTDEARAAFRAFFGDEVYGEYFGVKYTDAMNKAVSKLMSPESYERRQSVSDGSWPSYEEYVITEIMNSGLSDEEIVQVIMDMSDKYGWEGY